MSNENLSLKSVDDILTEQELLNLLGIKKSALNDELPWAKATT